MLKSNAKKTPNPADFFKDLGSWCDVRLLFGPVVATVEGPTHVVVISQDFFSVKKTRVAFDRFFDLVTSFRNSCDAVYSMSLDFIEGFDPQQRELQRRLFLSRVECEVDKGQATLLEIARILSPTFVGDVEEVWRTRDFRKQQRARIIKLLEAGDLAPLEATATGYRVLKEKLDEYLRGFL